MMYLFMCVCSQLHCVHFNTWDNSKDWTVPLPLKESIKVHTYDNPAINYRIVGNFDVFDAFQPDRQN